MTPHALVTWIRTHPTDAVEYGTLLLLLLRGLWRAVSPALYARWPRLRPAVEALIAALPLPDLGRALVKILEALTGIRLQAPGPPAPPRRPSGPGAAVLLVLALGVLACPRLPPVSGCQPGAQRCHQDSPQVCSQTQRWHAAGDTTCTAAGGVCVLSPAGVAHCAPGGAP